jgi:hypothetical protein
MSDMRSLTQCAVSIFVIVTCAGMATAQSSGDMKTVARDGEWEIRQSKDSFSDKTSCVLMPSKRPHIQITNNSLYISYRGRGGIQTYKVRVDDDPPSKTELPSSIEKGIQALGFEAAAFEEILKSKRFRVEVFTVLNNIVTDDIDIAGAKRLVTRLRTLCPDKK